MRIKIRPYFLILLLMILIGQTQTVFAEEGSAAVSKRQVLAKYETVLNLAQELNVYGEDVLQVVPKIRSAGQSLIQADFSKADSILNGALVDLQSMKARRPNQLQRAFRLEWLEIYREIFQKYAIIALLAYLFVHIPYFHRMLRDGRLTRFGKVSLVSIAMVIAVILSAFDLSHYGESAWAFLDIQLIFITLVGLLGGSVPGLIMGVGIGALRLVISPEFLPQAALAVLVGISSGLWSRYISIDGRTKGKILAAGIWVALLHGMATFLPTVRFLTWRYALLSVGFLTLLEAGAVFVFFAVISSVVRKDNVREVQAELLRTRLLFLQAQINPHFLYNALNTISAVCELGKTEQAQDLIYRLSRYLRRTARRMNDKVTLREEMAHIDSYIAIEKARFQDRLQVEKYFDVRRDLLSIPIPILILQPLVENAIKHGIGKKPTGGTLVIRMSEAGECVKITISDDGVGMKPELVNGILSGRNRSPRIGIGLKNIHERMIRLWGPEHGLRFETSPNGGTSVEVMIPILSRYSEQFDTSARGTSLLYRAGGKLKGIRHWLTDLRRSA